MLTRNRERYSDAYYHVYARGVRKMLLFHFPECFEKMIRIVNKACEKYKFTVVSFCLMNNHYHFLIHTFGEKDEVTKIMHYINTCFAMYFNKLNNLSGYVFQGHFNSKVVYDKKGLLRLIRYIERNPVAAGLVSRCEEWAWSSSNAFYNHSKHGFLDKEFSLKFFQEEIDPLTSFLNFINYCDEKDILCDPLNMNNYILNLIDEKLAETPKLDDKELLHHKLFLVRELTGMGYGDLSAVVELKPGYIRQLVSKINSSNSPYSERIFKRLNELRMNLKKFV